MNFGIIIQARTDSNRFPTKVLQKIHEKPLLWHVIERCKLLNILIIVATTKRKIDDPIIEISNSCNVNSFRGSTDDVLDRFYNAARKFSLDGIIRVTGDCPLIDPIESNKVLKKLATGKFQYVGLNEKNYPDGLDTEGFTFKSLQSAWKNTRLQSQREHVTPYLKDPLNNFKICIIDSKENYSKYRFTVDYSDDFEFVNQIYQGFTPYEIFTLKDIIFFLKNNPSLLKINSSHKRNEGYVKSISDDKII